MLKKIGWIALLVLIGSGVYIFRGDLAGELSFGEVSPGAVMTTDNALAVRIGSLDAPAIAEESSVSKAFGPLQQLLEELGLGMAIEWDSWWILPETTAQQAEATYTWVGVAHSGLAKAWQPAEYGPLLPYDGGEIYQLASDSAAPWYMARVENLLLLGRYPFQLEKALAAAKNDAANWLDDPLSASLLAEVENWAKNETTVLLRTDKIDNLPVAWQPQPKLQWQEGASVLALGFKQSEAAWDIRWAVAEREQLNRQKTDLKAWQYVPKTALQAWPLALEEKAEQPLTGWLGAGGWQLELPQALHTDRPAPWVWILPIADTQAYRAFADKQLAPDLRMEERSFQMFELWQYPTVAALAGLSSRRNWQPWVVELPDALLVSVYREDMEYYLEQYMLNNNAQQDSDLMTRLSEQTAASFQAQLQWGRMTSAQLWPQLFPAANWLKGGQLVLSGNQDGDLLKGDAALLPKDDASAVRVAWRYEPGNRSGLRMLPVQTHPDRPAKQVMLQNEAGDIWLINAQGTVVWTASNYPRLYAPVYALLEGGQVTHWAASSVARLHIWQANGQEVPFEYREAAPSCALTPLYFDGVSAPDLAVPTTGGTVLAVDLRGNPLQGWPAKLSGRPPVRFPLVHWQFAEEDQLIVWTDKEGWQILGKFGNFISSLPMVPEPPVGKPGWEFNSATPDASRLVTATATGKVNVWNSEGDIFPLVVGRGPVDNFLSFNTWGDGRHDYLIQRGSLVHLFGYAADNSFTERWQQYLPTAPSSLQAAPPLGLITMHDASNECYLLDGVTGQVWPGFPVGGSANAALGQSSDGDYLLYSIIHETLYAYQIAQ